MMNSYDLSRNFWNWAFDNPEKISPNHAAVYFFAIEHCNRLGWKEKFGFPSQMTMDAIGIKKHSTYIRYFNDLVEFGFFELIQKSKNQYSSNIISLTSANPKKGEAMDKAMLNHRDKHGEKQKEYKQTTKQETTEQHFKDKVIAFIDWFNQQKEVYTGAKGKTKGLSKTDENNLKKLLKDYTFDDFKLAIPHLFSNQWAKDTNNLTPTHFLRVDNFNKYLNATNVKPKKSGFAWD